MYVVIISLIMIISIQSTLLSSQKKPPNISQIIVSGLTQLFAGADAVSMNDDKNNRKYNKKLLTVNEVQEGIRKDFVNGYLFSGSIDSEIYAESCVFTDPTLSFKGLTRFEKNIKAIKPLIDTFIDDSLVVLYDLKEASYNDNNNNEKLSIKARWRMSGGLRLPWNPRIELTGQTRYTLDTTNDNRIIDYFETWNLPATTALQQLLQPSARKGKVLKEDIKEDIKAVDLISTKDELLSLIKQSRTSKREEDIKQTINKLKLVRAAGDLFNDQMSLSDLNNNLNRNIETNLKNTKWDLLYCSKEGFNPYKTKIQQEFVEIRNEDDMKIELCITNSMLLGLSFKVIALIELDKNDSEKIKVTYQQKQLGLGNINFNSENIKDKNQGYWIKLYEDKTLRIFENDQKNIFVLRLHK